MYTHLELCIIRQPKKVPEAARRIKAQTQIGIHNLGEWRGARD